MPAKTCLNCGVEFAAQKSTAQFCTSACRLRYFRKNKKPKEKADCNVNETPSPVSTPLTVSTAPIIHDQPLALPFILPETPKQPQEKDLSPYWLRMRELYHEESIRQRESEKEGIHKLQTISAYGFTDVEHEQQKIEVETPTTKEIRSPEPAKELQAYDEFFQYLLSKSLDKILQKTA